MTAHLCHTPTIRMATVCSGIGAPEVASIGLGFTHQFMAEIEPFPSAVLAHHWPEVPNLGDMTRIDGEAWCGKVDVLVGGTPCQAFSVAGKRESLDDARGNLTLKFVELCDAINPAYVVWENVPGVLSTKDNALGCFLGALSGNDGELFPAGDGWSNAGCVIGPRRKLAWRILDAQYFGLAQRRRRVFVVACPRDGADPCEILFEREGVQRHSAPSREKGEGFARNASTGIDCRGVSPTLTNKMQGSSGWAPYNEDAHLVPVCMAHGQGNAEIVSDGDPSLTCNHEAPIVFHTTQDHIHSADGSCHALGCGSGGGQATHAVAFAQNQLGEVRTGAIANTLNTNFNASGRNTPCVAAIGWSEELTASKELAGTLQYGGQGGRHDGVMTPAMQLRRLTPVECERLQGFPEIEKTFEVLVWASSDLPKNCALVETRCRKSQSSVSRVEEEKSQLLVNVAEKNSLASQAREKELVRVNVRIDFVRRLLQIHSQGKCLLSVRIAEKQEWFHPHIQIEDFARLSVEILSWLGKITPAGKVDLQQSTSHSTLLQHGSACVNLCGREIEGFAKNAERFTSLVNACMKSTTSKHGQDFQNQEQTLKILCYCAANAIFSYIPERTRCENSLLINFSIVDSYTRIPWRNKPAEDCPDGPRYKALGNSMAVPVMRWILRRIADAD